MNEPSGGQVVGLFITAREGQSTVAVDQIEAVAGQGLEGDRYFFKRGSSDDPGRKSEVTLFESEALLAMKRDYDIELGPGEPRRNIVTRAVALNHLVGCTFQVGGALLLGVRLCEPCEYMEKLTRPGVRKALIHRGGLRAKIVQSGTIRTGDAVVVRATG